MTRRQVLGEIVLVFAVFFIQGASPVPDVNEPYYLGKAAHFWNPQWAPGDSFLDSKDTHHVFYFTFGWLTLWLPLGAVAWFGRVLTWALLAWAWRRLSFAILPVRWYAVLTAALFVCLSEHCHLAGEWVVGGVEAKGFAYVFVLLGIEAVVRNRFGRAWLLLGAASAFHVLVGGWAAVAAGIAWLCSGKDRPSLRSMWPALLGGLLLSLPGLLPSLLLNRGVDPKVVQVANLVYVYGRLMHHLAPLHLPAKALLPFGALLAFWLVLGRRMPEHDAFCRLRNFVTGAVLIAMAGFATTLLWYFDRALAAGLLRFYWFRLADVAVPIGVALGGASYIAWALRRRPVQGRLWLAVAIIIAIAQVGGHAVGRPFPRVPRAVRMPHYGSWRAACEWVAQSEEISQHARFLTPRLCQTFKWYARRSEVVNWKEIPQDASAIVKWWRRIKDIHATGSRDPHTQWHDWLCVQGDSAQAIAQRLKQLGQKYRADYVLTRTSRPMLPLDVAYRNEEYVIYRLR